MKNVPYRTNEAIWLEIERFRLLDRVAPYLTLPVDTVAIAELVFRLTPVPLTRLFSKYKQDAAVTPDLKDLLIDEDTYLHYEAGDKWREKRLRFSVAHELCHVFLHAEEIRANRFRSQLEFKAWMGDHSNSRTAEYQADEFAGRLLVPREPLIEWYDRYRKTAVQNDPEWWQHGGARVKLSKMIAPRFGVNHQVIETRLDHEGIWPPDGIITDTH